jgi:predicted transcriptional regulator
MPKLHPTAARLLADIEAYRARVGIDRTAFGKRAAHDGHFIARVEQGRLPRITTIEQIYKYMERTTSAVRHAKPPIITIERTTK